MEKVNVIKVLEKGHHLTWDYDEEADVLYVSLGKPTKAMGVDVGDGTVVRIDEKKRAVVGITLVGFRKRLMSGVGRRRHSPRRWHGGLSQPPVRSLKAA